MESRTVTGMQFLRASSWTFNPMNLRVKNCDMRENIGSDPHTICMQTFLCIATELDILKWTVSVDIEAMEGMRNEVEVIPPRKTIISYVTLEEWIR